MRFGLLAVALCVPLAAQTVVTVKRAGGDFTDLQAAVDFCALRNEDPAGCIVEVDAHSDPPFTHSSAARLSLKPQRGDKWTIIRSSRISELAPERRVRPQDSWAMPKITATGTEAVIRFEAKARNYRLEGLEVFVDNRRTPNIIEIGMNHFSAPEDLPENIVLDRMYIHGPELKNTALKDAIKADGRNILLRNSYIHQIQNANGQETKAISTTNGSGPLMVRNNHIEALSIGSLLGGYPAAIKGQVVAHARWFGNHYTKDVRWKSMWIRSDPSGPCLVGEWRRNISVTPHTLWECRTSASSDQPEWTFVGTTVTERINPMGECVSGSHWRNSENGSFWDCIDRAWVQTDNSHTWTGGAAEFGGEQKNLWECKSCSIAFVEGNVLENAWGPGGGSQWGAAFLINSADSNQGQARWARAEHIFIRNNWTRNHGPIAMFGYLGRDEFYDDPYRTHHLVFENNLSENAMGPLWQLTFQGAGGNRWLWLSGGHFMRVANNTMIGTQTRENGSFGNGINVELDRRLIGVSWVNNIFPAGETGFRSGSTLPGTQTMERHWPDGDYRFNVMVNDVATSWVPNAYASRQNGIEPCCNTWSIPPATRFRSWEESWNAVKFVNFNRGLTDPSRGASAKRSCTGSGAPDPACTEASPHLESPIDGRPAGANIDLVEWATEGALTGIDNPWFDFQIRTAHPTEGIVYTAYSSESCRVTVSNDFNHKSPIYDAQDAGGDRDRTLKVGPAGSGSAVELTEEKIYYVRITCDSGRFRETELKNF